MKAEKPCHQTCPAVSPHGRAIRILVRVSIRQDVLRCSTVASVIKMRQVKVAAHPSSSSAPSPKDWTQNLNRRHLEEKEVPESAVSAALGIRGLSHDKFAVGFESAISESLHAHSAIEKGL